MTTITEQIRASEKVLIIGHQRPDGDCIGAGLALRHVCAKYGKQVDFVFDSPTPEHFSFIRDYDKLNATPSGNYDLVICVDCADKFRAGRYIGYLNSAKVSYNIDHHKTNDRYAQHNTVVPAACSTCEILYDMLAPLGEIDDDVAYFLMVGLSTDTGHFMHSNTNARSFEVAASLAKYAVDTHEIATDLYKNASYNKVKLIARAIESMRFFNERKICVMTVTSKDLEDCGCVMADTEGLIDYGMMISDVSVAVCISEQKSLLYKVSFRSKSIDVAVAAAVFGGGGHKLAAGCNVSGRYEDVIQKIVKSITDGEDF